MGSTAMKNLDGRLIIAGERVETQEKIKVENPATLEILGEVCLASSQDGKRAVEAARAAFHSWRSLAFRQKQEIFKAAKEILWRRAEEIARLITLEKGSPLVESLAVEVLGILETLDYYSRHQPDSLRPRKAPVHVPFFAHKKNRFLFQPLGPTLVISPWNFPFLLSASDVISALAAGNTVILRPSTSTPFCALAIGEIFLEAGLPPGVLNVVPCRVTQAEELILNPLIQCLLFTGSVATGKRIMEVASRNLTSLVLELGGKDPMIVLEDADVDMAARGAVWAGFMNTGQSCASVERIYVAAKIAPAFIERVVALTKALKLGNPIEPEVDFGPMENSSQRKVVEEHVQEAVAKGAEVLYGGKKWSGLPGYFYEPTVLINVDHSMKIMKEETFGPVLPIMTFNNIEEAIALANDSLYGLTASIWTRDPEKAARLAEQLEAGTVTINDHMFSATEPRAIWGGIKQTGIGRSHGPYGLLELVNIKYVSADFSGKEDRIWWYPYSLNKYGLLQESLNLLHGDRFKEKARALCSLSSRMKAIRAGLPLSSLLRTLSRLLH